jgi:hypothetical protein
MKPRFTVPEVLTLKEDLGIFLTARILHIHGYSIEYALTLLA